FKSIVVVDEDGLPGLHDRQYAVFKSTAVRCVFSALVNPLPMCELAPCYDVPCVWEGRDPASIVKPGVPADMIPMQVCAHHIIDVLRLNPDAGKIGEIRCAHPMKLRTCRAFLVVAEAGVDQDRVLAGFDDKGVEAEHQLTARRLDQPR